MEKVSILMRIDLVKPLPRFHSDPATYIYISIDVKEKRKKRWPSGTPAREECNEYDLTAAPYF
jgi:hypothetical protein